MYQMHWTNQLFREAARKTPDITKISGNDEMLTSYCKALIAREIDPSSLDITVTIRPVIAASEPTIRFHINEFSIENHKASGDKSELTAYQIFEKYLRYQRQAVEMPANLSKDEPFSQRKVAVREVTDPFPLDQDISKTSAIRQRMQHFMDAACTNTEHLRTICHGAIETLLNTKFGGTLAGEFEVDLYNKNAFDIGDFSPRHLSTQISFHPHTGIYDDLRGNWRSANNGIDIIAILSCEKYDKICCPIDGQINYNTALAIETFASTVAWPLVHDWLEECRAVASIHWENSLSLHKQQALYCL